MDRIHYLCLIRKKRYLLESMLPQKVLPHLVRSNAITRGAMAYIEKKESLRLQTVTLLRLLPNCGKNAFESFRKALIAGDQLHIWHALEAELKDLALKDGK